MGLSHSPNIVRDGLVALFDGANIRSFRGPAQTNILNQISYGYSNQSSSTFRVTNGEETLNIPTVGTRTVKYVDIYNDFNGGSGNCCLSLFFFGDVSTGVTGNTTYTYSILYKTNTGYTHPNYMYRYEYNGGSYVTEAGVHNTSNRTDLGDGWYHAWGTFTTQASTNRLICYLFHYEYATQNRVYVASVQITQGSYIGVPQHMLTPGQVRGTTNATGGGWVDLTGNTNHGEVVNGPTYNSSNGGSIVFDGTNDYVSIPNSASLQFSETFTVSAWVYPTNLSSRFGIFSTRIINTSGCWQLEIGTANGGTNRIAVTGIGTWIWESSDNVITTNSWHHICFVKPSNATQGGTMYVNGVELTPTTTTAYTITNNSDAKVIGAGTNSSQYLTGNISNILLYNKALSSTEVLQNFNATRDRFGV